MANKETTQKSDSGLLIPLLRSYPVRPDGTLYLSKSALRRLGWLPGAACQVYIDEANKRLIVEKADCA